MSNKEEKDLGFKITDRRGFSETESKPEKNAAREDIKTAQSEVKPDEPKPRDEKRRSAGEEAPRRNGDEERHLGPLNFSQFIMSLATSALIQMGDAQHPDASGNEFMDIEAARQTIDLIAMLKEKTKGNLEQDEAKLLDNILAELRFRFVQKTGPKS